MKIDYNQPSAIQIYTLKDIIKNTGYGAVVRYHNTHKAWYLGSDEIKYTLTELMTKLLDRMRHHEKDM